ncbi:hypothetical protein ACLOJK_025960 [Asimina triloba]
MLKARADGVAGGQCRRRADGKAAEDDDAEEVGGGQTRAAVVGSENDGSRVGLMSFEMGDDRRGMEVRSSVMEETSSPWLTAVIDGWLQPHRIWTALDVASKINDSDCPTEYSLSVGLTDEDDDDIIDCRGGVVTVVDDKGCRFGKVSAIATFWVGPIHRSDPTVKAAGGSHGCRLQW